MHTFNGTKCPVVKQRPRVPVDGGHIQYRQGFSMSSVFITHFNL